VGGGCPPPAGPPPPPAGVSSSLDVTDAPSRGGAGVLHGSAGRDLLLDQLLGAELTAGARQRILADLTRELERIDDPATEQAFRMLLLRAARIAAGPGGSDGPGQAEVAAQLTALAQRDASWLVTPGAVEASPCPGGQVRVTVQDGPPVDPAIEAQVANLTFPVGPELEKKYRYTTLTRTGDALAVTLAPTTWASSRRFHLAVQRDPGWASRRADGGWLTPMPFGDVLLPGIAAVQAIIMTADGQVMAARRSARLSYAPGRWSASFEEQLNGSDIGTGEDAFTAAARRGFAEEFGADLPARDVIPLTMLMETDVLNLGMVMLLRPAMTAEEIRGTWRSGAPDGWEADEVRGLPLGSLDSALAGLGPLHPTSQLRCLALRRWLGTC
jgi:hypothetical protein